MASLCNAERSQLVVIDIQQRLTSAMPEKVMARVIANTNILLQAAGLLDVAVIRSEQYPRGLGETREEVQQHFTDKTFCFEKTCFACTGSADFTSQLSKKRRPQILLTGIESHVCVLQTAIELADSGFQVYVVEDAVCSRNKHNHKNAIKRMRDAGVIVTNTESVVFEWLRDASHEHFKTIAMLIK
ncbi:MAG: isochorismatase family protein [Calditrichaceae bacterium]